MPAQPDPGSPPPSAAEVEHWNEIGSKVRHHAHIYHMHDGDQDSVDVRRAYESVRAAVSRLVQAKEEAERETLLCMWWFMEDGPKGWAGTGEWNSGCWDMCAKAQREIERRLGMDQDAVKNRGRPDA